MKFGCTCDMIGVPLNLALRISSVFARHRERSQAYLMYSRTDVASDEVLDPFHFRLNQHQLEVFLF